MLETTQTRVVAVLVFDGGQSLDIAGPAEVFALAARQLQEERGSAMPAYRVVTVAPTKGSIRLASGMTIWPDRTCQDELNDCDTLIVSGGMGDALAALREQRDILQWLRLAHGNVRRLGSVCSGALLMAEAGLLNGRDATTHWLDAEELKRKYPFVRVLPDAIYTRDGDVWTSAGVTAGMDMALAMLADDYGPALALRVAKRMVLVTRRSGGQSQFSRQLHALEPADPFFHLIEWMSEHADRPLSISDLAEQVHLSPRQFSRRFRSRLGATPRSYLEAIRLENVKGLLESTDKSLKRIAVECGFPSEDTLRRAFTRFVGVPPTEYRAKFAPPMS